MTWQPIETAPKDGTEVLLFDGPKMFSGHFVVSETYVHGRLDRRMEWWAGGSNFVGAAAPTHWMPLPEMPEDVKRADAA